jgi:biotin transport system substrate-specific component
MSQTIAVENLWNREVIASAAGRKVLGVGLFFMLTTLGAFVRIPLPWTPVPVTLQTLFVLLSGLALGGTLGGASGLCYLAIGSLGLPIFAGAAGGLSQVAGPTGGYLIAFPIASWLTGRAAGRKAGWLRASLAVFLGTLVIYILGAGNLAIILNCGPEKAFQLGVLPFVVGDALKAALALGFYQGCRARLKELFR